MRELLCELELPYLLRTCGRTSTVDWIPPPVRNALNIVPTSDLKNRKELLKRADGISIPYLVDPNSGTELSNSIDICDFLNDTYSVLDEKLT